MHSSFNGTIDLDLKTPGTPLSWAVHNNRPHIVKILLQNGADPSGSVEAIFKYTEPLRHAAYYHREECLRLMIEHLEGKVNRMTSDGKPDLRHALFYGPVIANAVHAADMFSMILRNGKTYLAALRSTLDLLREKTRLVNFEGQFQGSLLYYAVAEGHDEVVKYMFDENWLTDKVNNVCGDARRTPILEAVRWNRRSMYQVLLEHGANVNILAANPFRSGLLNWSALHIFAYEGHNRDVTLIEALVKAGVPVDGPLEVPDPTIKQPQLPLDISTLNLERTSHMTVDDSRITLPCETPLAVAMRHNAFNLASKLLNLGADPNALTLSSGIFTSSFPTSILGHLIISNARYSSARLRYILDRDNCSVDFIVEPAHQLSALHRAALAHEGIVNVDGEVVTHEDFDFNTNADIFYELLLKWKKADDLNLTCGIRGSTATHLAIEARNLQGLDCLLKAGAVSNVENSDGQTALQLAKRLACGSRDRELIWKRLCQGSLLDSITVNSPRASEYPIEMT